MHMQGLEEAMHRELHSIHDQCQLTQGMLGDSVPMRRLEQGLEELRAKVQLLANEQRDAQVEEHEVRLGIVRSRLDAHDERLALAFDRLDRSKDRLADGASSVPLDTFALQQRLGECEKQLAHLGEKQASPGGSEALPLSVERRFRELEIAVEELLQEPRQTQVRAETVAARLAVCEQVVELSRRELSESMTRLTQRMQESFKNVHGHLETLTQQDRGRTQQHEEMQGRVDELESGMRESQQFAGALRQSMVFIQRILQEVKGMIDVALLQRDSLGCDDVEIGASQELMTQMQAAAAVATTERAARDASAPARGVRPENLAAAQCSRFGRAPSREPDLPWVAVQRDPSDHAASGLGLLPPWQGQPQPPKEKHGPPSPDVQQRLATLERELVRHQLAQHVDGAGPLDEGAALVRRRREAEEKLDILRYGRATPGEHYPGVDRVGTVDCLLVEV